MASIQLLRMVAESIKIIKSVIDFFILILIINYISHLCHSLCLCDVNMWSSLNEPRRDEFVA